MYRNVSLLFFIARVMGVCAGLYAAGPACAAEGVPPEIVECLANEAAFSGYECDFVIRAGTAKSLGEVKRGEITQVGCEVRGTWARGLGREWVKGELIESSPIANGLYATAIDDWEGARARDNATSLEITPLVATLRPTSKLDEQNIFEISPWCSLGFLSPSRDANFGAIHFAFLFKHSDFRDDVRRRTDGSRVTYLFEISEGDVIQRTELEIDQELGHLPMRYTYTTLQNADPEPKQVSKFVSLVLSHQELPNSCVFPQRVVAYYYPNEQFPFFRARSFEASDFSPIPENADPLLIEAQEQIQLHNNEDVYVSAINRGEKVYLSDLPKLAGRLEKAIAHGKSPDQEPQSYLALQIAVVLGAVVIVVLLGKRFVFSRS